MISKEIEPPIADPYKAKLAKARNATAVYKTLFATKTSAIPEDRKVFVFEGVDDKVVYSYWIRALAPDLKYESYPGGNKAAVLQLFDALCRDRTGLGSRVYYFVDRDFDDLQGRGHHERIFLTKKYSIENYVVTQQVLDDVLHFDFHCNGFPNVRAEVVALFQAMYLKFLDVTKEINIRLYAARRLSLGRARDLPTKINALAHIELQAVGKAEKDADSVVVWVKEPAQDEWTRISEDFEKLDPVDDFRGKFALLFFIKWLGLLREDRLCDAPQCFHGADKPANAINGGFSLASLAPKSRAPAELRPFLAAIS